MTHQIDVLPQQMLELLNEAALSVAATIELDHVLQKIVDSARMIAGAQYGALGVVTTDHRLERFIHSGMDESAVTQIPHHPEGKRLLGALIDQPEAIRLPLLSADPRSVGFPANHPPMSSFLGIPLKAHGQLIGNIYLTNKIDQAEFTHQDQLLVEMLAAHAAMAVLKARLYDSAENRARQLAAINVASMSIASELALDKALQHIVDSARDLAKGQSAALMLANTDGNPEHLIFSPSDEHPHAAIAHLPWREESLRESLMDHSHSSEIDSLMTIPIVGAEAILGNLHVLNKLGKNQFTAEDEIIVELLAQHAAIAIQNARLYEQVEQLAVLEERTRIGMDLHDGVIQSIYGVGLTLESARHTLPDSANETIQLLEGAMDGLNSAIQDIRNFIMDLRPRRFRGNLEEGIQQLVREFQANTLIRVTLQLEVPTDKLPQLVARTLFLTTQEALANVARHAKAKNVKIQLHQSADVIRLTLIDDGHGFDMHDKTRRVGHGLSNMYTRAKEQRGKFQLKSAIGEGTTINLTLPLPTNTLP